MAMTSETAEMTAIALECAAYGARGRVAMGPLLRRAARVIRDMVHDRDDARADLEHLWRKHMHGCTDMTCPQCDGRPDEKSTDH